MRNVYVFAATGKGAEADFGPMPRISDGVINFDFGPLDYVMLCFR
jgi:hypothetical protein